MPKANQKFEMTLTLSAEEALWLKTRMQNGPRQESDDERNMRQGFFDALPSIQQLQAAQE